VLKRFRSPTDGVFLCLGILCWRSALEAQWKRSGMAMEKPNRCRLSDVIITNESIKVETWVIISAKYLWANPSTKPNSNYRC
jgi:hypothetical protein